MSEEDADDEGGEDNNEDYMDHDEDDEVDEDDGDDGFSSYLLVDSSGECRGILAATEYRETEGEDFEVVLLWPFSIRGHSLSYDP